jgi:riboflavin kinase / FMN adenylyltransferase
LAIEIITGWTDLPETARGAAVALGNFDGVHRGHQAVIGEAVAAARRLGVPSGVISFEPHPRRYFQPDAEPFRLMTVGQQARALEALGVDRLYLLPFDAGMAGLSDRDFAERVLAEGLGVRHVAVGFDITFGKGRTGSPQDLADYGADLGFTVSCSDELCSGEGSKLSSSAIREALMGARPEEATAILGRPFAIEGEVIHGDKRGRTIGVPTANVALSDYVRPAYGVYATRTRFADGRVVDGVANLGVRPMFQAEEPLLEVWLFDFAEEIYGQVIETEMVAWIRPELKFDGLEALKARIDEDAMQARAALARADASG